MTQIDRRLDDKKHKVQIRARRMRADLIDEPMFRRVVTLDPSDVVATWTTLAADSWAAEFDRLPKTIHEALVETLLKSKINEQETER